MGKTVKDKPVLKTFLIGREVCPVEGFEALRVCGCTMPANEARQLANDIVDEDAELFTVNPVRVAYEQWDMCHE